MDAPYEAVPSGTNLRIQHTEAFADHRHVLTKSSVMTGEPFEEIAVHTAPEGQRAVPLSLGEGMIFADPFERHDVDPGGSQHRASCARTVQNGASWGSRGSLDMPTV